MLIKEKGLYEGCEVLAFRAYAFGIQGLGILGLNCP